MATYGTSTYIGGSFTMVGNNTKFLAELSTTSSVSYPSFPSTNAQATNVVISDGSGGWYVGGAFTEIGGVTMNHLAHIKSDGSVDQAFNPNLNNTVSALALSPDHATLYAGGSFTTVAGGATTRNRLASFNTSDGSVTTFDPNMSSTVSALVLSSDGTTLYAGGAFATVGVSNTRHDLAAFTPASTSTPTTFNPNISSSVSALALSSDGVTLYVGGTFTLVGGSTVRNRLAAFTPATTSTATTFNPNMGNTVNALALSSDNSTLYAGGAFTTVGGSTARNRVAAFTPATTSTATTFDPNIGGSVNALVLSPDGATLYVGGNFTTVTSLATTRNDAAAFNTSDGSLAGFNPSFDTFVNSLALSSDGNTLVAGGSFNISNAVRRNNFALFDNTTGQLASFDAGLNATGTVTALALSSDGSTVYVGGTFWSVNSGTVIRNRLAAFAPSSGSSPTSFNPNMSNSVFSLAMSPDGTTLYAGGTFTAMNASSTVRFHLAAFTPGSSSVPTSFDPNLNGNVTALAVSPDGTTLYAGGGFTAANASTTARFRLAAFTPGSSSVPTSFDPNMNSNVTTLAVSPDGTTLYAGGSFTTVNGGSTTRNHIAAFTPGSSSLANSFDPNISGTVNGLAVSPDGLTVYAAGIYTTVGGSTSRNNLASFASANGAVTAFNPNLTGTSVTALVFSADASRLYIGGNYSFFDNSSLYPRASYGFVYAPIAPSSLGPANRLDGSYTTNTTPTFTFTLTHNDPNATVKYEIQIDDTSDFSSPVVDYTSGLAAQGSASFTVGQAAGSGSYTVGSSGQTLASANYYWRVKEIDNGSGFSSYTTANSGSIAFRVDMTAPTVPGTPVTTSPTSSTQPTWTWTASTDAGIGLSNPAYTVQWSQDSTFTTGVSASTTNANTFTQPTALADGTWYFRVEASDQLGNVSASSSNGSVIVDTTAPSVPGTPTTVSPTSSTQPTWTWTASTDTGSGLANPAYTVEWSKDSTFASGVSTSSVNTATFTQPTVLADGTWYFKVQANDAVGFTSAFSGSGSVVVDATAPTAPGTPTTISPTFYAKPSWRWAASGDAGVGLATSAYLIAWSQDCTFTSGVTTSTISAPFFIQPSALSIGDWCLRVQALDAVGNVSAYSPNGTVTIESPPSGGGVGSGGSSPSSPAFTLNLAGTSTGQLVVTSTPVTIHLNLNPTSVQNVEASLDPTFQGVSSQPYAPTIAVQLPGLAGAYTLFLRVTFTNGAVSVFSQTFTYNPSSSVTLTPIPPVAPSHATSSVPAPKPILFLRNLRLGAKGDDVKRLQVFLNTHGFPLATKGAGSPGKETTKFGSLIRSALISFQNKNASILLKPFGLKKGSGVFGPATRALVNRLLAQGK